MRIDQLLYGYRDGHRLLAGSLELSESVIWDLVRVTDRPSVPEKELEAGITFGFTLDGHYYALCRTWAAKEIDRPGAVWTHVLLLPEQLESPLECLPLLHKAIKPDEDQFRESKTYRQQSLIDNPPPLSMEAACLLLLFAAKPRAGLRAWSLTPPLELLASAQKHWRGILHNQPFSTSVGKKNIAADKKAVIISAEDPSMNSFIDGIYLSDPDMQIPSARITRSWDTVGHDTAVLQEWLFEVGSGIKQTTSNLKLVMEALLLGAGELDDSKLLKRISNTADQSGEAPILRYSLGQRIGPVQAPPSWIAALFLMGEENWGKWSHLVDAKHIGSLAATAPAPMLAERLVSLVNGAETRLALEELTKTITPDAFESLHKSSEDAAAVLIRLNPDLLFSLPRADRGNRKLAAIATGQMDRDLPWDLELLSRAPSWWRAVIAAGIRLTRSENDLIEYATRRISDGTWERLSSVIRAFLRETPHLLDELLYSNPSEEAIKTVLKEFGHSQVVAGIVRVLRKEGAREDKLADSLVAVCGPMENIAAISRVSGDMGFKFVAAVAEARWRRSHSTKVLRRIKCDLAEQMDSSAVIDFIQDKDLRKALSSTALKKK